MPGDDRERDRRFEDADDLGAATGAVPVFEEFLPGPSAARSDEVPAHLVPDDDIDSGDYWAYAPDGSRMWGRYGAAGLLVHDAERGVLLQLRASWSHFGGTWGIPGGALDAGEHPTDAALREAHEEADVPIDAVDPAFALVHDLGYWSYTTLIAETVRSFEARVTDEESAGLAWVVPAELDRLRLHPGFAASLPSIRALLARRPVLVVDAANVVGSRPDGWWRDRAGAAARLVDELAPLAERGVPGALFGLDAALAWPIVVVVLEGAAASAAVLARQHPDRIRIVVADGSGDDRIVEEAARWRRPARVRGHAAGEERAVVVVTADRELRERAHRHGAAAIGPGRLRRLLAELG